jgi:hypothetical protein
MPRDLIDAGTYAENLNRLEAEHATLQDEYEATAATAWNDDAAKTQLAVIRGRQHDNEATIAALRCARQVAEAAEARAADKKVLAARSKQAKDVGAKMAEIGKAANDLQAGLLPELDDLLLPLVAESRQRTVRDALSHRHEGACIVGGLQAAGLPGMERLEDMTPIEARRAYGGNVARLVASRLDHVRMLVRLDLAAAERGDEAEASKDTE